MHLELPGNITYLQNDLSPTAAIQQIKHMFIIMNEHYKNDEYVYPSSQFNGCFKIVSLHFDGK